MSTPKSAQSLPSEDTLAENLGPVYLRVIEYKEMKAHVEDGHEGLVDLNRVAPYRFMLNDKADALLQRLNAWLDRKEKAAVGLR